jgi:hypothetical protein
LDNRAEDARAISRRLSDRKQELIPEKQQWALRLRQLQGDGFNKPLAGDGHPAVREAQVRIEAAERELSALEARIIDASATRNLLGSLARRCHGYVSSNSPDVKLEVAKISAPKLPKGETAPEAVERLRHQLAELRADRAETEAAPIPSSQAKAIMRRRVAEIADRGKPDVDGLIEGTGEIVWPMLPRPSALAGYAQAGDGTRSPIITTESSRGHDGMALMIWLHQAAVIQALEAEIDECADDGAALSDETRKKKIEQLDARILDLEYSEVLLIEGANSAADFRSDTDPRAVLQVSGPAPKTE